MGLSSWRSPFFSSFELQQGRYTRQFVSRAAFFGIILLDETCGCPVTPKEFAVTNEVVDGVDRKVSVRWIPYQEHLDQGKPSSYMLEYGTNNSYGSQIELTGDAFEATVKVPADGTQI